MWSKQHIPFFLFLVFSCVFSSCRTKHQKTLYHYDQTYNYKEVVGSTDFPHKYPEPHVWALYPHGIEGLSTFMQNEMHYPPAALKDSLQGTVLIRFVVESDGRIVLPEVLESSNDLFEEEAIRLILESAPWVPATINRKGVRTLYEVPVYFML